MHTGLPTNMGRSSSGLRAPRCSALLKSRGSPPSSLTAMSSARPGIQLEAREEDSLRLLRIPKDYLEFVRIHRNSYEFVGIRKKS